MIKDMEALCKGKRVRLSQALLDALKVADATCGFCASLLVEEDEVDLVRVMTIHGEGGGDLHVLRCATCRADPTAVVSAEKVRELLATGLTDRAFALPTPTPKPKGRIVDHATAGCFLVGGRLVS